MTRPADRPKSAALRRRAPLTMVLAATVALVAGGVWYATRAGGAPGGVSRDRHGDLVQTVSAGQLPAFAQQAGAAVAEVYRFAASEDGKVLEWMPCYCGCGGIGHQHNRHCYIKQAQADTVTFTSHGGA
jgi:hypothetical protein